MTDSSKILVHRDGEKDWTEPESSSYRDEDQPQGVVAASPHRVPRVPEGAFSVRKFYTPAGPVDIMIVAPHGAVT